MSLRGTPHAKLLIVGVKLDRANRAPSLLTRLAQMFFRLQANEKTALCYSAHSHLGSNMATHKSVGVDVPTTRQFAPSPYGSLCESASIFIFFIGRKNPSPTDTNCFDSKMATLGISKSQIFERVRKSLCSNLLERFAQINLTHTIKSFAELFQKRPFLSL